MKATKNLLTALIVSSFLIYSSQNIKAQGTLQFNQVLLLSSTAISNFTLGTVPANKVWKVESFGGAAGNTIQGYLNGNDAGYLYSRYFSTGAIRQESFKLPVWLPAGTQLGFNNNAAGQFIWFSIIEFNIVP